MDTPDILAATRVGFAGLDVSPSTQETAIEHLSVWLDDLRFAAYRPQIIALVRKARWGTLIDSFYQSLPFGTGGRRGRVGIGPNRFNPFTLTTSIQGHAHWLRATQGDGPLTVVIGYDVRCFHDLEGELDAEVTAPVRNLSSRNFAEIAAEVYAAHEIAVYLPKSDAILSTPELSFAVRDLAAQGGLVISASHNPPDDNGSKFYHEHGGQMVPPYDQQLAEHIAEVDRVERMSLDRALANGLVREIPPEVHQHYIEANLKVSRCPSARQMPVVFTPLHGTADTTVGEVLAAAGFPVTLEPTQLSHDGTFPTVPFRAPNPERPATLEIAIATAEREGAGLVMGCDPDADRLGVAVKHNDQWFTLNGNEIAALVCFAALKNHPHPEPLILKTEVTSTLVTRIAEAHGARIVDHLLVGFKYIGEALFLLERKGRFGDVEGDIGCFAAGLEESHGVLVTPEVRDKDAAGGALLLSELAAVQARDNRTLIDTLNSLMTQHGAVHNHLSSLAMTGAAGRAQIEAVMASFRENPPDVIGDWAVLNFADRQDEDDIFGPIRSDTDKASRNVLVFTLEKGARLILRPSGTEPRCKIYVETSAEVGGDLQLLRRRLTVEAHALSRSFTQTMLHRIGIHLPDWALEISDLVSIEERVQWADELLPALIEQLEINREGAEAWLKARLDADHRALLRPGIEAMARGQGDLGAELLPYFS
jgi:phosphoglucomutase/phosphomannomutase